jgi:hypothetical protein
LRQRSAQCRKRRDVEVASTFLRFSQCPDRSAGKPGLGATQAAGASFASCYHVCEIDLVSLLAPLNGLPLNVTLAARLLGVSHPTALLRLRELERHAEIRILPSLVRGRRPILYLRSRFDERPASFRAACIEAVMSSMPGGRFACWTAGRVRRIDLVAEVAGQSVGFCFCRLPWKNADWLSLSIGIRRGVINRGFLLHGCRRAYFVRRRVHALPLESFLEEPLEWICTRREPRDTLEAMARINSRRPPPQ